MFWDNVKKHRGEKIARFIAQHGNGAVYSPQRNRIRAVARWSEYDGSNHVRIVDVMPNMEAARWFLNY